ncbi:MAG: DUF3466 family protein [Planctomycetota bacterium]
MSASVRRFPLAAVAVLVALILLLTTGCPLAPPGPPPPTAPDYSILVLDARNSWAHGINEHGEVVGRVEVGYRDWNACVWRPFGTPKFTDLGSLGGISATAYAINNSHQVAGSSSTGGEPPWTRAFLWTQGGEMQQLGTLGGNTGNAWDINNKGEVVGQAAHSNGYLYAFVWDADNGTRVVPGAGIGSDAYGIHNASAIVGKEGGGDNWATKPPSGRRWSGANDVFDIPNTLGGQAVRARDINISGTIVGIAGVSATKYVAFKWTPPGPMKNLGSLGYCNNSGFCSEAVAVNTHGNAVGLAASADKGQTNAVLWHGDQIYDLNDLLPSNHQWGRLFEANDINDKGSIVGSGLRLGPQGAYEAAFVMLRGVLTSIITPSDPIITGTWSPEVEFSEDAPFDLEIDLELSDLNGAARLLEDTVVVRAGQRRATFDIQVEAITGTRTGRISASFGGKTITAPFTVRDF